MSKNTHAAPPFTAMNNNPNPTIAYYTLGCKVNQYETEKARHALESAGFATVPFGSAADVCVVNTCSVTSVADSKSRAAIRKARKVNPEAWIVVTGCYSALDPMEVSRVTDVGLIVPNEDKDSLAELIAARFGVSLGGSSEVASSAMPRVRTRAVVKVQDGCDNFCAYCVIPYARPVLSSRPMGEVVSEVEALAQSGYKEVVLAGIRLGRFESGELRLPDLVRRIADIDGIQRIRLSSIEPWEVDEKLAEVMQMPKVCRHIHIPLQSGDDLILAAMNRRYTADEFIAKADMLRAAILRIGITTDVIVGFPGEDEEAFANTVRVVERVGFSRVHVFRYSARKRTAAAEMPNQTAHDVKTKRANALSEIAQSLAVEFAKSHIGQTLQVLAESQTDKPGELAGYTDNYIRVRFQAPPKLKGSIVPVRLTEVLEDGETVGVVEQRQ